MIDDQTLHRAIAAGLITQAQADGLRQLAAGGNAPSSIFDTLADPLSGRDDEQLRLISGFGDIFVTIGIVLFLGAIAFFGWDAPLVPSLAIAVLSWGLAEFFTRIRRMALPSIVLLITFVCGVFGVAMTLTAGLSSMDQVDTSQDVLPVILCFLIVAAAAALHYWRFRVPITVAAGVANLLGALLMVFGLAAPDFAEQNLSILAFILGLIAFVLAMWFDLGDQARVTRRTDIAFWLHMLAAPLLVHPFIGKMIGVDGSPWLVLAAFAVLAVIALIIDRRAILVSALAYVGYAIYGLTSANAATVEANFSWAILSLGAIILLLSAGWRPLRRFWLRLLPASWARKLAYGDVI